MPALPGSLLGYYQVPTGIEINSLNYPKVRKSIYCYHALYTYLYVLGDPNTGLGGCAASSEATQAALAEHNTTP